MSKPTLAQLEMLRSIWELTLEKGWPPSWRELASHRGHSSTNGVSDMLLILQREGWIVRENMQARSVRLTKRGLDAAGIEYANPYVAD